MRKALLAALLIPVLFTISSCLVQTTPVYYNPYSPKQYNFVSKDAIRKGERLKEQFPDNDFYYERVTQTYTFEVDESLLKKPDDQKKSKSKKSKKKSANRTTIYINESDNADDILRKLDVAIKSDWPESGVTILEKNNMDVVALNDKLSFNHAIFYDGTESISGVSATYANSSSTEFIVPTVNKSYEDEGIFHSDVKMAVMSVPMYVIGNSLQLNYNRTYHDYRYLTSVYLTDDEPCKEKVISFEVPEGLDIDILEFNFEGYEITRTEGAAPEKATDDDDDDDDDDGSSRKKKKSKSKKKKKSKKSKSKSQNTNVKTINYIIKNAPESRRESYNYGPTHSLPHLLVMCKSYTNGKDTMRLLENTDDLYKWYNTLIKKMDNENKEVKKTAEKLIVDKTTDEEKISAIFYWVQDNIRYIAFEDGLAGFVPDDCQNVFEKRYGDCKGMANLTKEMLRSVGFDARLTWIGTNRIAYDGTLPTLSTANHMICVVYPDSNDRSKRYFLDGTEKFVSFGDYAHRIQGRKVVIENGEQYFVDSIPEFDFTHNKIEKTETYSINDKMLSSTIKRVYHGESKTNVIRSYNNVQLDKRERALRTFLNNNDFNLSVSDVNHTNFDERTKPFEISYKLDVRNRIINTGKETYVNIEWDREWANHHLDTGRLTHYTFIHKRHLVKTGTLTIPAGYKVKKLPPAVNITNEYFSFKLSYKQQGNTIVYSKEIAMPKGFLHRKQIKEWNDAVEKVTEFYDSYIILTK